MGIRETFRKDEYPVIIVKNERSSLGSIKSVLPAGIDVGGTPCCGRNLEYYHAD